MNSLPTITRSGNQAVAAPKRAKTALECVFAPRSVALIGATEAAGSVGRTILNNLLHGSFSGKVYPINPKRASVLGVPCLQDVSDVPERVDLAVVVTPAAAVPDVIGRCSDAGAGAAVIISAGFKESGPAGAELERRALAEAKRTNLRLVGPNCLGVMNPRMGLNATFATEIARPGRVAFLSQSGALGTAVLDWSLKHSVGFSAFISTGSMLDIGWGDLIDYFGDDAATQSILIYMESIGDVRSFMSAAREVALTKPIIVIKAGRSEAAAKAAVSHTGALAGSDDVLDAAFRRAGVLRVERISDLFYMADVLSRATKLTGNRLAIVTNAGGPGVLATDALVAGGGELAQLSDRTHAALNEILPKHWSHGNPVDVLGDASPDRYAKTLEIIAQDENNDGILAILTPQAMTDPAAIAEHLTRSISKIDKPVLASWMGAGCVQAGREILNKAGIPNFEYPDSAARVFNYMSRHASNLKLLYETPTIGDGMEEFPDAMPKAGAVIDRALEDNRTVLTEIETKWILDAYGIPVVETHVASTPDEAAALAQKVGFPVVLKLFSHTITHKTDVGGVQLNLHSSTEVEDAFKAIRQGVVLAAGEMHFKGVTVQRMVSQKGYELILGSSTDAHFGPVIMFGLGGQLVEVFKDRALGLPPLNDSLARRLIEQTKIHTALRGVRGRGAIDLAELEKLIVRFSQLVIDHPWIKEIEINPLLASPDGMISLDARAVLHSTATPRDQLPRPAIRPYPSQYIGSRTLRNGAEITIRPIRPEDEPSMIHFHNGLSEQSVRHRYFYAMSIGQRVSHERLVRVCLSDYDRQIALVAEWSNEAASRHEIIGVGRLGKIHDTSDAEFAVIVADKWQHLGLGTFLLKEILRVARDEKIKRVFGDILAENIQMQRTCEKIGFTVRFVPEDEIFRAEIVP
jgi:acetyltransferase